MKESFWWRIDDKQIYVYTNDTKTVQKIKVEPFTTYIDLKTGKFIGWQYVVEEFSKEWREVFDTLELGKADERKNYSVKLSKRGVVIE